jgi:hypothetical protein
MVFLFCFLAVLGLHLEPLHQPFFVMGFFPKIGSLKLFPWAGFEP